MLKLHDNFLNFLIEDVSIFTNNFDNKMYIFEEIDYDEITIFIESYNLVFRFEFTELLDNNNYPYNLICKFKNKNFVGFNSIYINIFTILLENEENKIIKLLSSKLPIDIAIMCIR